jgi:hypothetical protein
MSKAIIAVKGEGAGVSRCIIYGNDGGEVDFLNGIYSIHYYEDLLEDCVRATVILVDSVGTINGTTALDGLPIVGQEKVELTINDNNNNAKSVVLFVNSVKPYFNDTNRQMITLDLVSKEYIINEQVRVRTRYDGKISDHIDKILKDVIKTEKKIDLEQTINTYNFLGNNKKPFYTCRWLSKKSVPTTGGGLGKTAGFFFYEVGDTIIDGSKEEKGFYYKSIDTLMKQEHKVKLMFNTTVDKRGEKVPEGYDGKVVSYNVETAGSGNVTERMKLGLYNTKIVTFDPFNCFYKVTNQQADDDSYEKGGKKLPKLNDKDFTFNKGEGNEGPTKTSYFLIDTGSMPSGNTQQQIQKSQEPNLDYSNVVNYSTMRYNNLFSSKVEMTIPGTFKLSVGDTIFVDSPKIEDVKNPDVNQQHGGKYLISRLCHYVDPTNTYTVMDLVRESVERKA